MKQPHNLILASTSKFRKKSLKRLGIKFSTRSPKVDEDRKPNESPKEMALRLAFDKASAVFAKNKESVVIGGDQVLAIGNKDFGKPMTKKIAIEHLKYLSGKTGTFHTAICIQAPNNNQWCYSVPTQVTWRKLTNTEINTYMQREPSLHSAGAAQLEAMGISLVESMQTDDPTAIVGIPLLSVTKILCSLGFTIPPPA